MKKIEYDNKIYAIYDSSKSIAQLDMGRLEEGTEWYGEKTEPLQGSRMLYHSGKEFKVHRHKINPRAINYTQEAMICLSGKAEVAIYNADKKLIETIVMEVGSILFLYRGFHGLKILNDNTILYELKAGQFSSVEQDKEFLDD